MTMTNAERRRAAQTVLAIPFFHDLWDELEQAAINSTIFAPYDDHEGRQANAAEARAIKRVRERLRSLAEDKPAVSRRAPA